MDQKNNIPSFTWADIERYHKGLMTAEERHALEKAALDDPMLADAVEGFETIDAETATNDIAFLRNELEKKIYGKKFLNDIGSNSHQWLKIAALFLLVIGAGWMVFYFGNFSQRNSVAINQNEVAPKEAPANTLSDTIANSDTAQINNIVSIPAATAKNETVSTFQKTEKKPVNKPPQKVENIAAAELADSDESPTPAVAEMKKEEMTQAQSRKAITAVEQPMMRMSEKPAPAFVFRGQVMDENNNPLPFANVTNTIDNIGTYTDAKGNFTLTSPDTVLNVKIKSVGFENSLAVLKKNLPKNKLVLKEDTSFTKNQVLAFNKTKTSERKSSLKIEEPEPIDGWDNYDLYIANNIQPPEELQSKQTRGEVEISFEVNQQGEPVNIKVEKSLCDACDKEAVRVIKEGPKWKKGKGKRARLRLGF